MITIAGFAIDAALRLEPAFEADVTELPVERGGAITDHVRARPITVTIEGVVSDTPLPGVAELREEGSLPSADARIRLFEIWNAREPVTIETENATYADMVMQSFHVPEDGTTGDACHFTATFKQVRLVTNSRTSVQVSTPRAAKKINRGTVPSTPVQPDGPAQPPPAGAIEDASRLQQLAGRDYDMARAAKGGVPQ